MRARWSCSRGGRSGAAWSSSCRRCCRRRSHRRRRAGQRVRPAGTRTAPGGCRGPLRCSLRHSGRRAPITCRRRSSRRARCPCCRRRRRRLEVVGPMPFSTIVRRIFDDSSKPIDDGIAVGERLDLVDLGVEAGRPSGRRSCATTTSTPARLEVLRQDLGRGPLPYASLRAMMATVSGAVVGDDAGEHRALEDVRRGRAEVQALVVVGRQRGARCWPARTGRRRRRVILSMTVSVTPEEAAPMMASTFSRRAGGRPSGWRVSVVVSPESPSMPDDVGLPSTPPASLMSLMARSNAGELGWSEEGQRARLRQERADGQHAVAVAVALDRDLRHVGVEPVASTWMYSVSESSMRLLSPIVQQAVAGLERLAVAGERRAGRRRRRSRCRCRPR